MIRWIIRIIKDNIKYFPQTRSFAKADLKRAHMSSDLGIFWAVAKPIMYLLMFYVAISSGFKGGTDIKGTVCPYFIWLAAGIVQWQFISDLLVGGSNSFYKRKSVIKSCKYPVTTIPMIAVLSKFYIYLIMIGVLVMTSIFLGVRPSIYWLQLPLYIILTVIFLYIWVLMTSMMNVISADMVEFIKTIRTAFFWLSGILFNIKGRTSPFFMFNPISYLAEGFRNTFAYHIWIWEEKRLFLNFMIVLFILSLITFFMFRRMEKKLPELI